MNDQSWVAFLDALAPEQRDLAQIIMQRITTLLEKERSACLVDVQRIERRQVRNAERIDTQHQALDDMIGQIQELEARVTELERLKERERGA